ncbi:MAG: hypothetical protein ACKO1O_04995, partial [Erythrobacter sp.]
MFLRLMFAAATLLLLGGCQGWIAETRLIPVFERDPIGLDGTYSTDEGKVTITQRQDGLVVMVSKKNDPPTQELAFDFLREETELFDYALPAEPAEGEAPPEPYRTYLMELPIN